MSFILKRKRKKILAADWMSITNSTIVAMPVGSPNLNEIWEKESFLYIGLDTDITKIPKHLLKYKNPVLEIVRWFSYPFKVLTVNHQKILIK